METNLGKIKRLSREKEKENLKFISALNEVHPSKLDTLVHKLYRNILHKIDCKTCGNCCKNSTPVFTESDIERFIKGLATTAELFKEKYLAEDKEEDGYVLKTLPCPFLKGNLCTNYEYRPEMCRSYPHLHKDDIRSRLTSVVSNTDICPIIFNLYEQLKKELSGNVKKHPNDKRRFM